MLDVRQSWEGSDPSPVARVRDFRRCSDSETTQGGMKKELIELRVNGRRHELAVEPSELLLDVLRRDLQLTGSKRGCDDSSCGACTVLVDGVPTLSCTMLALSASANGPVTPEITTVEGITDHG